MLFKLKLHMNDKPILQKDIAEVLGISINTVSHALRGLPDISAETTAKVRNKAKEMGYIPNSMAIKLKTGSSKTIALVYDNLINPYFMIMASKLFELIKSRGYDCLICPSGNNSILDTEVFNDLLPLQVDGIFSFLDVEEKVATSKAFQANNVVIVGRASVHNISSIYVDDFHGGELVGEYFKNKGYKNILYVGAHEISESSKRLNGLKTVYGDSIMAIEFSEKDDVSRLVNFIKENNIDAVFGFNDILATIVQKAIEQEKLPIDVVGFDAIHKTLPFVDDITSVTYDFDKIAENAIEELMRKINGDDSVKKIKVSVSLYFKGETNL